MSEKIIKDTVLLLILRNTFVGALISLIPLKSKSAIFELILLLYLFLDDIRMVWKGTLGSKEINLDLTNHSWKYYEMETVVTTIEYNIALT